MSGLTVNIKETAEGFYNENLSDMDHTELVELVQNFGQPKFRASQIFKWIGRGAGSFSEMTDLPVSFRDQLASVCRVGIPEISATIRSNKDETTKFIIKLYDGQVQFVGR